MSRKGALTSAIQALRTVYALRTITESFAGYRYTQKYFLFNVPLTWKRDRGLDHAVEKENNLKALIALKDIVKKKPGASLPMDAVSRRNGELGIPIGVKKFIRKYPSTFEQYAEEKEKLIWFRLTKEALELEEEEARIHQEQESDAAMRLCKLLMMTRQKRVHLALIDLLKWDMGLPEDYVQRLVPRYPDYFTVIKMPDNRPGLDLVCWNDDLAMSEMERRAANNGGYEKGMPLAFPMTYSKGYDVKQGYVKWAEGWQRLPYVSPYDHASHVDPSTDLDLLEKRVVGVLHEVLSLMVAKRAVRRYLVDLQEQLGLPMKFERCFERHPGIFYLSSKNGTVTVMLREAYKRDELIEPHPLMSLRGKFVHVMKKGSEERKKKVHEKGPTQQKDSIFGASDQGSCKSGESEESSDDSTYDEKDFSDDEEEEDITDESSESDEDVIYERDIKSYRKEDHRFQSPGIQTTNLKASGRQGDDSKSSKRSRTSGWQDNNRKTSGRKGKSSDTSGRQAGNFQPCRNFELSGITGNDFEMSRTEDRKSSESDDDVIYETDIRTYRKQDHRFQSSAIQTTNLKASGRQGTGSKSSKRSRTSGWQDNNRETSGRKGKSFDTSGRQAGNSEWEDNNRKTSGRKGKSFDTSGRQAGNSGWKDNNRKTSGRKGKSFDTSGRQAGNSGSQDNNRKTNGRKGKSFDTSGRQAGNLQPSRNFELSGITGNDFEMSRTEDRKSKMFGKRR